MSPHDRQLLAACAALGPAGGQLAIRTPHHSRLERAGLIELHGQHAVITGEGLDALARPSQDFIAAHVIREHDTE